MPKSRESFRSLLAKSGKTLEEFARIAKVPRYTLYRLKTDPPPNPWGRTLQRIADGLTKCGVPCDVDRVESALRVTASRTAAGK